MPILTPKSDATGSFEQVMSLAGWAQVLYPDNQFPNPLPTTIAGGATWNSGLLFSEGYRYISVGVTSTQAGSLVIQEYLDLAGTIARTPSSTSIVANTALIVDVADLKPFATFTVSVSNSAGTTATLSGFQLLLAAG